MLKPVKPEAYRFGHKLRRGLKLAINALPEKYSGNIKTGQVYYSAACFVIWAILSNWAIVNRL